MEKTVDITWENAINIAKSRGINKNDFAKMLNKSITTVNNWANGTRQVGKKSRDLMDNALGIDPAELLMANNNRGGQGENVADEKWELKMVLEGMSKRLDALHDRHEGLIKLLSNQREEVKKLYDFGLELQRSVTNVNYALDEINSRLNQAAEKKDIEFLKKTGGTGI